MITTMLNITLVCPTDVAPQFPSEEAAARHLEPQLPAALRPVTVRMRFRSNTPRMLIVIDGGALA
jgi:hypothetical protein